MQYPIPAGWIVEPQEYRNGLVPPGGLSERDIATAQKLYPFGGTIPQAGTLSPFASKSYTALPLGAQLAFRINVAHSRQYQIETFGEADTVLVLMDDRGRTVAADDDAGYERNAQLRVRLEAGRDYTLRLRQSWSRGEVACVMLW
jgi:hypothetical protein